MKSLSRVFKSLAALGSRSLGHGSFEQVMVAVREAATRWRRTLTLLSMCVLGLAFSAVAHGQTGFPSKPLRIIVPTSAGAPHDTVVRLLSERLAKSLGQPVIVDNQAGATGAIALASLIRAAPDGHTFGLVWMPQAIQQSLIAKVSFDMVRDTTPIGLVGWDFNILVVHSSIEARTVADLVAHLKSNPDVVNFASGGNGSPAHVLGENFKQVTGTKITHVPFKGSIPAVQDLLAGRVQMMIGIAPATLPHIRSGALRPLAVTAQKRLASVPTVPTFAEAGYPELAVGSWFG